MQPHEPALPPVSRPARRRWLWVAIAAAVALVVGAAVFASTTGENRPPPAPTAFTLMGSLLLDGGARGVFEPDGHKLGRRCTGDGGYDDIGAGTPVTVYAPSGDVLAVGRLDEGRIEGGGKCRFGFTVPLVPKGHPLYQVEVSHRGKIAVRAEVAETEGAQLSLG